MPPCTSKILAAPKTESNPEQRPSISSSEWTSNFNLVAMRTARMAESSAEWTTLEFTQLLVRVTRSSGSQENRIFSKLLDGNSIAIG